MKSSSPVENAARGGRPATAGTSAGPTDDGGSASPNKGTDVPAQSSLSANDARNLSGSSIGDGTLSKSNSVLAADRDGSALGERDGALKDRPARTGISGNPASHIASEQVGSNRTPTSDGTSVNEVRQPADGFNSGKVLEPTSAPTRPDGGYNQAPEAFSVGFERATSPSSSPAPAFDPAVGGKWSEQSSLGKASGAVGTNYQEDY